LSTCLPDRSSHLERLFPTGGVILISEASMAQEGDRIISILRWFRKMIVLKHKGTWKLFLRPNIKSWLGESMLRAESDSQTR
jgi:chromo domain-containing protein 1